MAHKPGKFTCDAYHEKGKEPPEALQRVGLRLIDLTTSQQAEQVQWDLCPDCHKRLQNLVKRLIEEMKEKPKEVKR